MMKDNDGCTILCRLTSNGESKRIWLPESEAVVGKELDLETEGRWTYKWLVEEINLDPNIVEG
jgi:hypothetical protein